MDEEQVSEQAVPTPGLPVRQADFEMFWIDHYRDYLKVLMSIGATVQDAEDTIGEVVADMMRKQSWSRLTDPKAWVRQAVLHTYYSRRKRERERPEREVKGFHVTPDSCIDQGLTVWEDKQWVRGLLGELPETQRAVVALIVDDYKPSEIAELLGKSPDAIRQNLAHGRRRLKLILAKDAQIDPVPAPRKEDTA